MKKILIGTPSYDGKVYAHFFDSFVKTKVLLEKKGYHVEYLILPGDAIIQRARNVIFKHAYDGKYDYLVFIDSDIRWKPEDMLTLLRNKKDIVAGAYRLKSDKHETYAFKKLESGERTKNLVEIDFAGTGFMAISWKCIKKMVEISPSYHDGIHKDQKKVFDIIVGEDGTLNGEDTYFCRTARKAGFKVFLDKRITVDHIGQKIFQGDVRSAI